MSTGDIVNGPYASRAREYVWSTLADVFPRRITPSDFDAVVELNRCFFVFEGKTEGKTIDTGQGLCLRRAIEVWPAERSVVVIGHHPPLDRVDVHLGVRRVQYGWYGGDEFVTTAAFRWGTPHMGPGCLWDIATMFVKDAEQNGALRPWTWPERLAVAGRPFTEEAS